MIKSSKIFLLTHLRSVWTKTVVVYDLAKDCSRQIGFSIRLNIMYRMYMQHDKTCQKTSTRFL